MRRMINENHYPFSPEEARKAFGLYLGFILRKISQSNADPACCDLVTKFLQQSSSNLRTPFLFTVNIEVLFFMFFSMKRIHLLMIDVFLY